MIRYKDYIVFLEILLQMLNQVDAESGLDAYLERNFDFLLKEYLLFLDAAFIKVSECLPVALRSVAYSEFHAKRNDLYPSFLRFVECRFNSLNCLNMRDFQVAPVLPWKSFFFSLRFLIRVGLVVVLSKWFCFGFSKAKESISHWFYVFHRDLDRDGKSSRFYGDIPSDFSGKYGHLITVCADGYYISESLGLQLRRLVSLRNNITPFAVLEAGAKFFDLVYIFFLLIKVYARRNLFDRKVQTLEPMQKWVLEKELTIFFDRLIHYKWLDLLGQRVAGSLDGKFCFFTLFEHNIGKVQFRGIRGRSHRVGVQHGTYSRMRLGPYFSPLELNEVGFPETVFAEGRNHAIALNRFYPMLNVCLVGAMRNQFELARFSSRIQRQKVRVRGEGLRGVVLMGLHSNQPLITFLEGLTESDRIWFKVKRHPKNQWKDLQRQFPVLKKFEEIQDSSDWLDVCDFVISYDSSLGIELLSLGFPSFFVVPSGPVNLSPISDLAFLNLNVQDHFVKSEEDVLNRFTHFQPIADSDFYFYRKFDAKSSWVSAIRNLSFCIGRS